VTTLRFSAVILTLQPMLWAADTVHVRDIDGVPALLVDGERVPPHMLFNATWDTRLVADSLAQSFARAGIHLHQFDANLDWRDDFDQIEEVTAAQRYRGLDERLRALSKIDPEVLVLLRVHVSPPHSWGDRHPAEILTFEDGTRITKNRWMACHSYASSLWRQQAGARLTALIRHLQANKLERQVLGYLIFAGWSGEWNFFRQTRGDLPGKRYAELSNMAVDHSPAMAHAFRAFLLQKYAVDSALRSAWRSESVSLAAVTPPTENQVRGSLPKQLNDPRVCAVAADYFECNAKQVADSLLHFAGIAKRSSPDRICGAFFGEYLFSHIGGNRTPQRDGHAELTRVLASPDIDFICSPQSYQARQLGGYSPSMCLVDSARLHGKLVWYEFDQPTHLSKKPRPGVTPANLAETRALMRRGFGYALTKGMGLWWWDQEGRWGKAVEGGVWYASDEIRSEFALYQRAWQRALTQQDRVLPRPEIAVIYDPGSCLWQQSSWRDLSYDLIYRQVDALGKMGAPYDIFSLDDLARINGYRLYIVLNPFHLTHEQTTLLKQLVHRPGVTTLWFYAPGYLSPDGLKPSRVSELTGLNVTQIAPLPKALMSPSSRLVAAPQTSDSFGREKSLDPTFRVDGGQCLATYEGTGVPAGAAVKRDGWQSFYFASAPLPGWLLRDIVRAAGCHQYVTNDDVVYVGPAHLVLHTARAGGHEIRLPKPATVKRALTGEVVAENAASIRLECNGPRTWIFELGR